MLPYIEAIQNKFHLEEEEQPPSGNDYTVSQRTLALGVGYVAIGLPIVLFLGTFWGHCFYDSISHFYFSRLLGDLFVGSLFFIGAFLFAYRSVAWVTWLSTFAGIAAFGVAIFPTAGAGCGDQDYNGRAFVALTRDDMGNAAIHTDKNSELFELFPSAMSLHFGSAAVLLLTLAFFCFVVFTRVLDKHRQSDGTLIPEKARRNRVYIWCGRFIMVALTAIGLHSVLGGDGGWWDDYNMTFIMEAVALWAFGLSWALKGRLWPFRETRVAKMVLDPDVNLDR